MQPSPSDCLHPFADPDDFRRVREVLARADFSEKGVSEVLRTKELHTVSEGEIPPLLHLTRAATPQNTLIRLFLIGIPTHVESAREAVAPMTLEKWIEAGLLRLHGGSVFAGVQLLPHENLLLAYDRTRRIEGGPIPEYVMGLGGSSLTLANLTVRRRSSLTLDLGTGCGFQAFLAARHSDRVLAVDQNPRAVQVAAFNARLNGLPNVEFAKGNLFEPVRGSDFDLVVANPPFVISPESRYIYRDSGMPADEISQRIVCGAPPFLREGAYCQIICDWVHLGGQDWKQRLAEWLEGSGCDAWVICFFTVSPASYATKWIKHTESEETETFQRRFDQWMTYYEREGIEAISGGLITMRRKSRHPNWVRVEGAPEIRGRGGDCIVRGFALRDFVEATRDDEVLMNQRLRLAPETRLQQRCEPASGGWRVVESILQLQRGLGYSGTVGVHVTRLLAQCDGGHRLGDLMNELAMSLGQDLAGVAPEWLTVLRELIESGFLLPVEEVA